MSPYLYDGDDDVDEVDDQPPPVPLVVATPAEPAAPAKPIEPLLLENHSGEWVRIPTGSQMAIAPAANSESKPASAQKSLPAAPGQTASTATPLPPAVIVFRDGHSEEVGKYMIQADTLYMNADYWSTGVWTRKIPLSQVDIPASLKLNEERGSKFNLPSRPNEVVVRF